MAKFSPEFKEKILQEVLDGKVTLQEISKRYNWDVDTARKTLKYYETLGPGCLVHHGNRHYSYEEKMAVIRDYLEGKETYVMLDIKYRLVLGRSEHWVRQFRNGKLLKDTPRSDSYRYENGENVPAYNEAEKKRIKEEMASYSAKEKLKIVLDCKNSGMTIKDYARQHNYNYSTLYSWIHKYDQNGEKSLKDGRGRPKQSEPLSELERLRLENRRLKKELEQKELINEMLKKKQSYRPSHPMRQK